MASKCAVVATNVGGVPDYAIPDETAIVVPPHDSKKLEEGIAYLLDNWENAKIIAENGYMHIKQFTWEKAAEEFYEALLKGCSDNEIEVLR
jgi:glycosyltransferase involved in cell wall biosynthesis